MGKFELSMEKALIQRVSVEKQRLKDMDVRFFMRWKVGWFLGGYDEMLVYHK